MQATEKITLITQHVIRAESLVITKSLQPRIHVRLNAVLRKKQNETIYVKMFNIAFILSPPLQVLRSLLTFVSYYMIG